MQTSEVVATAEPSIFRVKRLPAGTASQVARPLRRSHHEGILASSRQPPPRWMPRQPDKHCFIPTKLAISSRARLGVLSCTSRQTACFDFRQDVSQVGESGFETSQCKNTLTCASRLECADVESLPLRTLPLRTLPLRNGKTKEFRNLAEHSRHWAAKHANHLVSTLSPQLHVCAGDTSICLPPFPARAM